MAREYEEDERIKAIATGLIVRHHGHLAPARIAYVMKKRINECDRKPPKESRKGKGIMIARARLVPEIYRLLSGYDFIIEADEQLWDRLTLEQQEAVIDHELCHCARDDKGWYLRDHDVHEFREVLARHGLWEPRLEEFVAAAGVQKALPFVSARAIVSE